MAASFPPAARYNHRHSEFHPQVPNDRHLSSWCCPTPSENWRQNWMQNCKCAIFYRKKEKYVLTIIDPPPNFTVGRVYFFLKAAFGGRLTLMLPLWPKILMQHSSLQTGRCSQCFGFLSISIDQFNLWTMFFLDSQGLSLGVLAWSPASFNLRATVWRLTSVATALPISLKINHVETKWGCTKYKSLLKSIGTQVRSMQTSFYIFSNIGWENVQGKS